MWPLGSKSFMPLVKVRLSDPYDLSLNSRFSRESSTISNSKRVLITLIAMKVCFNELAEASAKTLESVVLLTVPKLT